MYKLQALESESCISVILLHNSTKYRQQSSVAIVEAVSKEEVCTYSPWMVIDGIWRMDNVKPGRGRVKRVDQREEKAVWRA